MNNYYVVDPLANKNEVKDIYDIELTNFEELKDLDCIVYAVPHKEFDELSIIDLEKFFKNSNNEEKVL